MELKLIVILMLLMTYGEINGSPLSLSQKSPSSS